MRWILTQLQSELKQYLRYTVKFREISPGAYIFKGPFGGAYFWRGLSTDGNLRFKIDWASRIVGSKFTVFALFYFVFEGNFPSTSPRGAYIWRGDLTEGFCVTGLGAYILRGSWLMEGPMTKWISANLVPEWMTSVYLLPGDTPWNSWWRGGGGVLPSFPNPDPISDQKSSFPHLFSDLTCKIYIRFSAL